MPTVSSLQKEAGKICAQIVKAYNPEKVILFGSLVTGSQKEPSDIDLLVIKKTSKKKARRAQELYRMISWSFPLDLIVRTPSEVKDGLRKGIPFYQNALKGDTLYAAN